VQFKQSPTEKQKTFEAHVFWAHHFRDRSGDLVVHIKEPRKMQGWKRYDPCISRLLSEAATASCPVLDAANDSPALRGRTFAPRPGLIRGIFADKPDPGLSRFQGSP
jgi:hypothetical protein